MKVRMLVVVVLCWSMLIVPAAAQRPAARGSLSEDALERRREIAQSALVRQLPPGSTADVAPAEAATTLAQALDIDLAQLKDAAIVGSSLANAVASNFGVIKPTNGGSFAALSTGVVGSSAPEPGTDLPPSDSGDQSRLRLNLLLPAGVNQISFDYNFLSAELPDFQGTVFNDTFTAIIRDSYGVREMARASVNSSAFFPASAAAAGGSGFDIFAADPRDVDFSFGTGLPDAGLTGFKTVAIPTSGGNVTIEFVIEDRGDDILDSAVLIDNLVLTSIEAVDPNPALLNNGDLSSDPAQLAIKGKAVTSAAADGVTKVLLRTLVAGPGSVEFCIANGAAPQDGGLAPIGSSGRAGCVTTPAVQTSRGYMAFAAYQSPDAFDRGGDGALVDRPVQFRARFTSSSGAVRESTLPFKIARPPVVLIHGLWSSSAAWTFPLVSDERFRRTLSIVNYSATNASWFSTNLYAPHDKGGIKQSLLLARQQGIATTQVDIVGHSMGGILSRNYTDAPGYRRSENYNAGDLNRIITLNTPHLGSPWANLILDVRRDPIVGGIVSTLAAKKGHPIDRGAIDDLAVGSDAIQAIGRTPVPSHAVVGIVYNISDRLTELPAPVGDMYTMLDFFVDFDDLFKDYQHDGIVWQPSQEGGIAQNARTVLEGWGSFHTKVGGSGTYSQRVIELLNASPNSAAFAEFPATASVDQLEVGPLLVPSAPANTPGGGSALDAEGVLITSPASGAVVAPSATVQVVVEPQPGFAVDRVLLAGPGVSEVDNAAPFEFTVTVPEDAVGELPLSAVGSLNDGAFTGSNTVTLKVVPTQPLSGVTIASRELIFSESDQSQQLGVLGAYSDGAIRDLTDRSTGTQYISSDPSVVSVSAEGVVRAAQSGVATVIARNGGTQDSITVRVVAENQAPVASAGLDQNVALGTLVTLDGSQSFDPDSDTAALVYEWYQVAGPPVALNDPTTATPSFKASQAGQYAFSLIVRDGQDDSLPDTVNIRVGFTSLFVPIINN